MKIAFVIAWLLLAASAVAAMFLITFEVEKLEARLHEVNREIAREQEAIHVLHAEWSYLNRPQRLEALSQELLPKLAPVASTQFTTFARLPKRIDADDTEQMNQVAPARYVPLARTSAEGISQ